MLTSLDLGTGADGGLQRSRFTREAYNASDVVLIVALVKRIDDTDVGNMDTVLALLRQRTHHELLPLVAERLAHNVAPLCERIAYVLLASCCAMLVTNLPAWHTSPPPREKKKLASSRFWSKLLRATVRAMVGFPVPAMPLSQKSRRSSRPSAQVYMSLKRSTRVSGGQVLHYCFTDFEKKDNVEADSKDNDNRTPLSWAAANGYEATVKLLLETGKVEAGSKDNYNWTPISGAAQNGHEAIVKLLLETGKFNVDSKDIEGRIPLFCAAQRGKDTVVKLLREHSIEGST